MNFMYLLHDKVFKCYKLKITQIFCDNYIEIKRRPYEVRYLLGNALIYILWSEYKLMQENVLHLCKSHLSPETDLQYKYWYKNYFVTMSTIIRIAFHKNEKLINTLFDFNNKVLRPWTHNKNITYAGYKMS